MSIITLFILFSLALRLVLQAKRYGLSLVMSLLLLILLGLISQAQPTTVYWFEGVAEFFGSILIAFILWGIWIYAFIKSRTRLTHQYIHFLAFSLLVCQIAHIARAIQILLTPEVIYITLKGLDYANCRAEWPIDLSGIFILGLIFIPSIFIIALSKQWRRWWYYWMSGGLATIGLAIGFLYWQQYATLPKGCPYIG